MKKLVFFLGLFCYAVGIFAQDNNLIAYYPFNGNANDESGNGNHGTVQNQIIYESGNFEEAVRITAACGSSYYCTGSTGGHILIPFINFNLLSQFTICMWVNELNMIHSHGEAYISFGDHINQNITIGHFGSLQFIAGGKNLETPFDVNYLNQWKFYVLKYNSGTITAYIDAGEIGVVHGANVNLSQTTSAIGRHWWNNGGYTSTRMNGLFDEVRIYDRALTEQEIQALYTENAPPQPNSISNIIINMRNDGSGMLDVYFNLSATGSQYNIKLETSFDGGSTFAVVPASYLSGDINSISPGNNKHLIWDGFSSNPNIYSEQTKIILKAH